MREFVAVDHPMLAFDLSALKRQALMFSRIAIPSLTAFLSPKNIETKRDLTRNLEWLIEAGILFEPTLSTERITNNEYQNSLESLHQDTNYLLTLLCGFGIEELQAARENSQKAEEVKEKIDQLKTTFKNNVQEPSSLVKPVINMATHFTRLFSIQLRELDGLEAYPILPTDICLPEDTSAKNEVIRIVLNALPVPDEQTSWEQIIEYRDDPDSQSKFLDLRNWMTEIGRNELTSNEAEEKLEYLLSQYRRHIEIHRMKANTGKLETVIVTGAEVLGDFASFQWGKAAQALFSIKRRHLELLEGELTARGSEVAYIMKARDAF